MHVPSGGILDLRDLHRYPWQDSHLDKVLDRILGTVGLGDPGHRIHRFTPPPRLVVVANAGDPPSVMRVLPWLASAEALILIREVGPDDPDPDVDGWAPARAALPNLTAVLDLRPTNPEVLGIALDWARDPFGSPWPSPPEPSSQIPDWPEGPWIEVDGHVEVTTLGPRLCLGPEGPSIDVGGAIHPLSLPRDAPLSLAYGPTAVSWDGRLRLSRDALSRGSEVRSPTTRDRGFGWPVGFDASHPVVTDGVRSTFAWNLLIDDRLARLCRSSHGWPCGHAKKLWGFKDNAPVQVIVAPDATAVLSTFEHDALIASSVPLPWRVHGSLAVADWPPDPDADPLRALFFGHDPTMWDGDPGDPNDDDTRTQSAVVVLGPDAACRYAVDLSASTWRIRGETSDRIDDGTGGYAVFRSDHSVARRGSGRLLGGWFRFATILDGGRLWRENLATAVREDRGPHTEEILAAVAVPGTANVVLLRSDSLRLV